MPAPTDFGKSSEGARLFSSLEIFSRGRRFYYNLWPEFDASTHRYALEASTGYTKVQAKPAGRRIRNFRGSFRFLYIVRNPVDRIESHLAHNIAKGRTPFEAAVAAAPEPVIQVSRYAAQVDAFCAGVGNAEVLLLDFDELRTAPLVLVERRARFLDLDPSFRFTPIPPTNTRKTANRADEFRLAPEQRAVLAEALGPDIRAFRDRYGFDVSGWNLI